MAYKWGKCIHVLKSLNYKLILLGYRFLKYDMHKNLIKALQQYESNKNK